MGWHTVRQGEDLRRILFQHAGSYSVEEVRRLPENEELFASRRDTVLLPGDRIFLPDVRTKHESGETEQRHRFRRLGRRRLCLVFHNEAGDPMANLDYNLNVEGDWREGTTDDEGRLEELIPMTAENAQLIINGRTCRVRIAHLDPVGSISGAQARLRNLGFYTGTIDGENDEETQEAIRTFQQANDLEPTGEPDDRTRQALEERHRC